MRHKNDVNDLHLQWLLFISRNYIKYAKQTYKPVLSDAAGQQLIQNYVEMRKIGSGRGQITAYPRQLESLIRLAEAHARMRFSDSVDIVDVEEAARLHREALKQSATDPTTGKIDVSILTTGTVRVKNSLATLQQARLYIDKMFSLELCQPEEKARRG